MQAHALRTRVALFAALALALTLTACKLDDAMPPTSATATHDAAARESARLRAHVLTIPGVTDASVIVTLPTADPFARAPAPAAPARVAYVIATTAAADTAIVGDAAITAARTALGADAAVDVQLAPIAPSPRLVSVGPFTVAAPSRGPLLATLVVALLIIATLSAGLALALARAYRRGIRPQ